MLQIKLQLGLMFGRLWTAEMATLQICFTLALKKKKKNHRTKFKLMKHRQKKD